MIDRIKELTKENFKREVEEYIKDIYPNIFSSVFLTLSSNPGPIIRIASTVVKSGKFIVLSVDEAITRYTVNANAIMALSILPFLI